VSHPPDKQDKPLESPNFGFLKVHDPQLVRLGTLAEQYFAADPVTCLMKLRQFGELLGQLVAANAGLYASSDEPQLKLLNRLRDHGYLRGIVDQLFHELRRAGNDANHVQTKNPCLISDDLCSTRIAPLNQSSA
jgi:type I restriction enzyme R subunit